MDEPRGRENAGSPLEPGVDQQGHLTLHCTQCGSSLDPSSDFCTVCAAEVSGGGAGDSDDAADEKA